MIKLMIGKEPWFFFWIEIWDKWISRNKWWTTSLIILSKFVINNERSDTIICQWFILIDNLERFLLIRNYVKSESWLLFDYNKVSCLVLRNKIYWWNMDCKSFAATGIHSLKDSFKAS